MCHALWEALYIFPCLFSQWYAHKNILFHFFFFKEVTKIELRVVKFLVQNHTAGKRKNWNLVSWLYMVCLPRSALNFSLPHFAPWRLDFDQWSPLTSYWVLQHESPADDWWRYLCLLLPLVAVSGCASSVSHPSGLVTIPFHTPSVWLPSLALSCWLPQGCPHFSQQS